MGRSRRGMKGLWIIGALLAVVVAAAWFIGSRTDGDGRAPSAAAEDATGQIHRNVTGRIVRLSPNEGTMTVDHDAIEGFMPAMVMDLPLADPREVGRFSAGDEVIFDLVQIGGEYRAVMLREGNDAGGLAGAGDDHEPIASLGPGDLVPDLELYDPSGERFHLREMEPRHRVITFFYVRCPLQDYCPTQSLRLSQLQRQMAESPTEVHLVSLTLDAEHDRPEVLADYANRFQADSERWTLAGADDAEAVRDFAHRAGGRITRHEAQGQIDHALIGLRVDGDRIVDVVYGLDAIESMVMTM